MDLSGETLIAAPRERVWAALNDPEVLAACIEGVERLERAGENRFEGTMNAKVGPVRAKFTGAVELSEIDAPNAYVISGEGKGGVAGFAKGKASVRLEDAPVEGGAGTRLTWQASSTVGGKLAQLGARLIEGTAKAYAESFFATFKTRVESDEPPAEPAPIVLPETDLAEGTDEAPGLSPAVWGGIVIVLVAALVLWLVL
ncbi:CoxG family protein [Sphingosinicella microcystinivorans]|uniref:CoxG family protein n=1 Tax=Sphingosinicella microcystinivorans TaxID=335406 RepID=UPI0022F3943B|nr:carbon monoxide dehydrogenase subunit G [Sphingosinicella microcystinivorans]WBX82626.1 carbon monoxide dehydrogenase subunit G [Sphingosinicella microcystinivorans]